MSQSWIALLIFFHPSLLTAVILLSAWPARGYCSIYCLLVTLKDHSRKNLRQKNCKCCWIIFGVSLPGYILISAFTWLLKPFSMKLKPAILPLPFTLLNVNWFKSITHICITDWSYKLMIWKLTDLQSVLICHVCRFTLNWTYLKCHPNSLFCVGWVTKNRQANYIFSEVDGAISIL